MNKTIRITAIAITTGVMMVFTFYLMKLPWLASDEKMLIWATSAVKFGFREMPKSEEFAFINTSYDLQLIDRYDEYGFPVGNQPITDRRKLAELLSIINQSPEKPRFVIIDIHFVDSTTEDKNLFEQLSKMDNVILSAHINNEGRLEPPLFSGINYGLSDYVIGNVFDGVYKYQLIYEDTLKLLPLKVHENLSGKHAEKFGPFVKIGDQWTSNNFIMNYRILQKDLLDLSRGFNPVSMGELLYLETEDIQQYVANKIVVIGDFFESDMHETIFEITAGPLILVNAYLTLREGDTTINLLFFILMALVYAYLSYMVYYEGDVIEVWVKKIANQKISRLFIGFASYFILLSIYSILCFALFNIHVNVFFVSMAFYTLDRTVHLLFYRKTNQLQSSRTDLIS